MLGNHLLDLILLVLVALFAVSGYRQGFIVGTLSFVGFVGGGVLGAMIAPPVARALVDGPAQQALLAIVIAFVCATIGQLLASSVGAVLRSYVTWDSARTIDHVGGAFVSALSLLLVAWFIGLAVQHSPISGLRRQVKDSYVLKTVDEVAPDAMEGWFSSFQRFVSESEFPQVFGGLGGESVVEVPPPDPKVLNTPQLRKARESVVKIQGTAPDCQRRIEGTGFAYDSQRIMTNAHVVAGVKEGLIVNTLDGARLPARVVVFDYKRDIAVLYVPGLRIRTLDFNGKAQTRDDAVVAGFPKGRPFSTVPARVRAKQRAEGPDIYRSGRVTREIYAIRGKVEQGNSGGPLLARNGGVYGVIFAAALDTPDTGYALTAEEVAPDAEAGRHAVNPVSTRSCSD